MAIQTSSKMTVADYIAWEAGNELKHEFIDGEVIDMTGGTGKHSNIAINITIALGGCLNLSDYVLYNSDMRVRVGATRYVYPDLSVVRGVAVYEDESDLMLLNPVFVVEVTSPSSMSFDRVDKLGFYLDVPSIEAYLIVDQDLHRADLYTRADDGWLLRVFSSPEDVIPLSILNCEVSLGQIYRGIAFAEA